MSAAELAQTPSTEVDPKAIPSPVFDLCRSLVDAGHRAWVVGGCVRDHLLHRPVSDWDICTTALPREVMRVFPRAIPTGIEHGTVTVVRDHVHYEVTTLRGEGSYSDGRRPDEVHFLDDITKDLARRDFTVNAIAYDPIVGITVDPFDGRRDLAARILRAVGDPTQRFNEDGLRILRGARFVATLEFMLDDATERAMESALHVFRKVSAERVRDEWMKTMSANQPSRAFEVMLRRGIIAVVSPELAACVGCAQGPRHAWDVWEHSLRALDATPRDPVLRMAALLHDIGKVPTRDLHFDGHDRVGAELADVWMKRWRFSNEERARVVHVVRHHLIDGDAHTSDATLRRVLQRVTPSALDDVMTLALADIEALGINVAAERARLTALRARLDVMVDAGVALTARDLAIDGTTLMRELAMKPSKQLGETLTWLVERVLDDPNCNTREGLLALARERISAPHT